MQPKSGFERGFFSSLLSCLLSRILSVLMPPQSGRPEIHECRKQEAGQRRRLIKLSCAGWIPQDRGFVSGLPRSKGERRPWAAHNRREDSQPRPASRFRHRNVVAPLACCRNLHLACDRPNEPHHLPRDRRDDDDLLLSGYDQPAISSAKPNLCFPGDVSDRAGQLINTIMQFAAHPGLHTVGPGSFSMLVSPEVVENQSAGACGMTV
jgi:hypothetical protein